MKPKTQTRKLHYQRPKSVQQYQKQREFIDAPQRYTIVEAATKAGKTLGCIVWLFEQAFKGKPGDNFWWVAPVYSQSWIAFRRLCRYISDKGYVKINKTECSITLRLNGAVIYFKSADHPDSLYGDDVSAVVIDEATRMKEDAWFAIRSTLTQTKGRAKIIGNVKGINNWAYRLARQAENAEPADWKFFKLTADDAVSAGIIPKEEIDDAARTLPQGVFLELYYGIPNQNSANKFCYAFDEKKHIAPCRIKKGYPVYLSFDFNRNPICCSVIQHYGNAIYVIECIKLPTSNIYKLCEKIHNKFPDSYFIITGDASGRAGSALVPDSLNYYKIIERLLELSPNQFRTPPANPGIEQNQVLINSILEHYTVKIDADNAQGLIFDMKFVELSPDGKIKKQDRNNPTQQADALDTFRYWCNVFMKNFLNQKN